MARLTVNKDPYTTGLNLVKITGFGDGELSELKSMTHQEAEETLIGMLDSRNGGIGTTWACGYGIYDVWFDNDTAYMSIGNSCD